MKNVTKTIEDILCADTDDLKQLAQVAGVHHNILYLGADLEGADLRNQDIKFLVGLGADYSGSILTNEQRVYLTNRDKDDQGTKNRRIRSAIAATRQKLIREFVETLPEKTYNVAAIEKTLVAPFKGYTTIEKLKRDELNYLKNSLDAFNQHRVAREHVVRFLTTLSQIRVPIAANAFEPLNAHDGFLELQFFRQNFDINLVHDDFFKVWLRNSFSGRQRFKAAAYIVRARNYVSPSLLIFLIDTCQSMSDIEDLVLGYGEKGLSQATKVAAQKTVEFARNENDLRTFLGFRVSEALKFQTLVAASKAGKPELASAAIRLARIKDMAISGIALSDAVLACKKFSTAHSLARKIADDLVRYELTLVRDALSTLAQSTSDNEKLRAFERKYIQA